MRDEDEKVWCGVCGLIIGILFTVALWIMVCVAVEGEKVSKGYLTLKHKTYSVILYDTLERPGEEE